MPEELDENAEPFIPSASVVILAGHGSQIDAKALDKYTQAQAQAPGPIEIDMEVPPGVTVTVWSRVGVVRRGRSVVEAEKYLLDDEEVGCRVDEASFGAARAALPDGVRATTFTSGERMPNLLLQHLERPGGMPTNPAVALYRANEGQAITLERVLEHLQPRDGRTVHVHWSACTQPLYATRDESYFSGRSSFGSRNLFEIFERASTASFSDALSRANEARRLTAFQRFRARFARS